LTWITIIGKITLIVVLKLAYGTLGIGRKKKSIIVTFKKKSMELVRIVIFTKITVIFAYFGCIPACQTCDLFQKNGI
jgi:hypothetical protein